MQIPARRCRLRDPGNGFDAVRSCIDHGDRSRRSDPVLVRAVIDGDTIDVATVGRVRLLGIDAPEIGRRLRHGGAVCPRSARQADRAGAAPLGAARNGRRAASTPTTATSPTSCAKTGLFVNAALVREGLARVSRRECRLRGSPSSARRGRSPGAPPRHVGRRRRPCSRRVILGGRTSTQVFEEAQEFVAAIPVEYASQRKIRERNKLYYRFNHWPIWIFVFFIAPGPLTFDLFEHGFDVAHGAVARRGAGRHRHRRACAAACRASSRSRTSSASPRIARTRSTAASATRSRGAK